MVAKNIITVFNIIKEGLDFMSMFGDYKAYKRYEPAYANWKQSRDIMDAKRLEYLKQNPQEYNPEDVQRGKTLLRAIDIMDEYSQKRAQNMEVAANSGIESALMLMIFAGGALGGVVSKFKPVQNLMVKMAKKFKLNTEFTKGFVPMLAGILVGTVASFPLQAWAAKIQVEASRKGRFEAMRKDLKSPNGFAILTPEQIQAAKRRMQAIPPESDAKKLSAKLFGGMNNLKEMAVDSKEYRIQRNLFEAQLAEQQAHLNDSMSAEEIEKAKKEQQLLTKLVEKIDIASQDYAQNAEMGISILTNSLLAGGFLTGFIANKILSAFKVQSAGKIQTITQGISLIATIAAGIWGSLIAKDASRVGRFKIKQELAKNPENLVYISDDKAKTIGDVQITKKKKGMIPFLKEAWANRKEYLQYQKTTAKDEKRFYKAVETLKLTPEQLKDAKRLQKNTFMTFNTVDEKSQKYSESVEALGESVSQFVVNITSLIAFGLIGILQKDKKAAGKFENILAGIGPAMLAMIPAILLDIYITKEQKNASRVADMLAINELSDYRQFRG